MGDRLTKIVVVALLVVLAVYVGQPYVDRLLFSASAPRAVEPRGNLSDLERSTIALFERDSPSVVQVVARAAALETSPSALRPAGCRARRSSGPRPITTWRCCASTTPSRCRRRSRSARRRT